MGFKAKLQGSDKLYAAKITGDSYLSRSDNEMQMFNILNAPPTIPNIPKIKLYIPSMPNPFKNRTHLEKILRVERSEAKWLVRKDNISITVSLD